MAILPDAEQCISYVMPAFRLRGKTVAGFAAFKNHLSYLPHSGSVLPQLSKELAELDVHGRLAALPSRPAPSGGLGEEAAGRPDGGGLPGGSRRLGSAVRP